MSIEKVPAMSPLFGLRVVDKDDLYPRGFTADELNAAYAELARTAHDYDMLMESATMEEVSEYFNPGTDKVAPGFIFEAIVIDKFSRTEHRMNAVVRVLNKHLSGSQINALPAVVEEPKKSGSFAYVTVQLPFSDGQVVSVIFHSPEGDKKKIAPTDTIIAFRWLLNKRDITHLVAPEDGSEVSLETIGKRVTQLVEKNSARFERTQKEAAAERKALEEARENVGKAEVKQQELMDAIAALNDKAITVDAKLANAQAELERQKAYNAELQAKIDGLRKSAEHDEGQGGTDGGAGTNEGDTVPHVDETIEAPYRPQKNQQTFIAKFYKSKNDTASESFERFNRKKLSTLLHTDLKEMFGPRTIWRKSVERGEWNHIRIFTTFNDNYEADGPAVVDMSMKDFFKYLNVEPISEDSGDNQPAVSVDKISTIITAVELPFAPGPNDIIMNAQRPLAGHETASGNSVYGRNFALIRMDEQNAMDKISANVKLDAKIIIGVDRETLAKIGYASLPAKHQTIARSALKQGGKKAESMTQTLMSRVPSNIDYAEAKRLVEAARQADPLPTEDKGMKAVNEFIPEFERNAMGGGPVQKAAKMFRDTPPLGATEGQPEEVAKVALHYFGGNSDWYIKELDLETGEAFGFAVLNGDTENAEYGYINLRELAKSNYAQLDLYWDANTTMLDIKKKHDIEPNTHRGEVGGSTDPASGSANKATFEITLDALMNGDYDSDTGTFSDKLDEAAEQAEAAGQMDAFEARFNEAADRLTELLKKKNQGA